MLLQQPQICKTLAVSIKQKTTKQTAIYKLFLFSKNPPQVISGKALILQLANCENKLR